MEFDFYKLHFCGDDLIFINSFTSEVPDKARLPSLSRKICNRKTGIGGNGVIVCRQTSESEGCSVDFYTANGQPSPFYGDALLCTARFAFDFGLFEKQLLRVYTQEGMNTIRCIDSNNFRVSLGCPLGEDPSVELREIPDGEFSHHLSVLGREYVYTPVRFGGLSAIVFVGNDTQSSLRQLSMNFRRVLKRESTEFTYPIFVSLYSRDEMAIYIPNSRGRIDICAAAASSMVAAVLNGIFERDAVIHHKRGEVFTQWTETSNEVFITGSPEYVYRGTYYQDDA
jgi:diaminopimelate epimerase